MKRHFIKDKELSKLIEKLPQKVKQALLGELTGKSAVEKVVSEKFDVYLTSGRPVLVETREGRVYPTLLFSKVMDSLSRVVVDMGAVPHVCRGADVMRPGVVEVLGDFTKGELVLVVDEKHRKPIALGFSIHSSSEIIPLQTGKIVEAVHFVGDSVWRFLQDSKFI